MKDWIKTLICAFFHAAEYSDGTCVTCAVCGRVRWCETTSGVC